MSKYKVGDKVVLEITDKVEVTEEPWYILSDATSIYGSFMDKAAEPLTAYIEQARADGAETAWELARKCMLMTDRERKAIFGSGHNALYGVLTYFDYEHAAAKVAEWGEKIKIGDVIRAKETATFEFCVTEIDCNGHLYGIGRYGETCNNKNPEEWEKTGRRIDIYSFLKQIGGEE